MVLRHDADAIAGADAPRREHRRRPVNVLRRFAERERALLKPDELALRRGACPAREHRAQGTLMRWVARDDIDGAREVAHRGLRRSLPRTPADASSSTRCQTSRAIGRLLSSRMWPTSPTARAITPRPRPTSQGSRISQRIAPIAPVALIGRDRT